MRSDQRFLDRQRGRVLPRILREICRGRSKKAAGFLRSLLLGANLSLRSKKSSLQISVSMHHPPRINYIHEGLHRLVR